MKNLFAKSAIFAIVATSVTALAPMAMADQGQLTAQNQMVRFGDNDSLFVVDAVLQNQAAGKTALLSTQKPVLQKSENGSLDEDEGPHIVEAVIQNLEQGKSAPVSTAKAASVSIYSGSSNNSGQNALDAIFATAKSS
ncbi:hypothetical protein [uncultured Cohaesibacter sp.]|uniref:hypothetical protein n=1 Tax=uncultured Cohaesibacter sp. TaxID=1002546 RepID=UPI00292F12A9|nr:hypothetical protein [uncultured Cohaesibacter sp.]